jgi:hypothetical protein
MMRVILAYGEGDAGFARFARFAGFAGFSRFLSPG